MGLRRENEQRYAAFWSKFVNFMNSITGIQISGIARSGSRRRGDYRPDSDLDIIFAVSGDSPREQVYPPLVEKLRNIMNEQAGIGGSYHVINIRKDSLDFDLVLLSRRDFDYEVNFLRASSLQEKKSFF